MHRISRSSSPIIEVAQNPLRVLFVIRECEVLSRKRINGEKSARERERVEERRERRGGPSERLPIRSDPVNEREATGGKGGEEEEGEGGARAKRESNENESRRAQFVVALICHRVPFCITLSPSVTYHLARLLSDSTPSPPSTHIISTRIHYFHCYLR